MHFHTCGYTEIACGYAEIGKRLDLDGGFQAERCLDGVPSPFMADSEQSSGFDGQTQFALNNSADASQVPQLGCIRCCVDALDLLFTSSLAPKTNFLAPAAAKL